MEFYTYIFATVHICVIVGCKSDDTIVAYFTILVVCDILVVFDQWVTSLIIIEFNVKSEENSCICGFVPESIYFKADWSTWAVE